MSGMVSHLLARARAPTGPLLVLAAAVLWGTTGTAQGLAPAGAQPEAVGAARLAVGGLGLLALAGAQGVRLPDARWPWRATALAAASMAAYQLCFFSAVARAGVAIGTAVAIGSAPILAGALGWLARGERPGRRWLVATLLAIGGGSLLVAATRGVDAKVDGFGLALAVGAGAAYATYTVASKRLLENTPPDLAMAAVFCLAALLLLPLLLRADLTWLAQPRGMAVALHLGLVATTAAYALFARGLALLPVATAVTLSLAEPLTAATLGIVVLGERLTPPAALGAALVLCGLAILSTAGDARPREERW